MRKLILILLFGLASITTNAANWTFLGVTDQDIVFIDEDSITTTSSDSHSMAVPLYSPTKSVFILYTRKFNQKHSDTNPNSVSNIEVSCISKPPRLRAKSTVYYGENGRLLRSIDHNSEKFEVAYPNTVGEDIIKKVCFY